MLRPPSRMRHRRGTFGSTAHDTTVQAPTSDTTQVDTAQTDAIEAPAAQEARTTPPGPPLTTVRRPGTYVMTDDDGTEVAVIHGDYVIGFTAHYLGRTRFIKDLDEAKAEITRAWLAQAGPEDAHPQAG